MNIDMISVGDRIRNRRKELKLTQTDIYHECGIASGALSQIENGNRTPSILIFFSLSQVLNCSMEWLMTGVSTNTENFAIYENEENLLRKFRLLSEKDKADIQELIEFKLYKAEKEKEKDITKSPHSGTAEIA